MACTLCACSLGEQGGLLARTGSPDVTVKAVVATAGAPR